MTSPAHSPETLKERKDFLWGMYQESCAQSRHHESQRSNATNIILAITIALVSIISGGGLRPGDWPLTCALIVIGIYGTVFTWIHFDCIAYYRKRAAEYRGQLEELLSLKESSLLDDYRREGKVSDGPERSLANKFRVFWPLTISLIGVVTTACIVWMVVTRAPR